jgi:PAS domain S-box-containing protein
LVLIKRPPSRRRFVAGNFMNRLFHKQLLIAILPVLVLAAFSTLWTTRYSEQQLLAQLRERLQTETMLHAAGIRAYFDSHVTVLQALAATPIIQRNSREEILPYLARESARLDVEGLYHVDLSGNVYWPGGKDFEIQDRAHFAQVVKGELVITNISKSRATNQPIVLLLTPIFDTDGQHVGALGMSLEIGQLLRQVEALVPQDEGFAAISDASGNLLTPFSPNTPQQRDDLQHWLETIHQRGQAVQLDDENYLVYRAEVYGPDWQLVVGKRTALATQPATQMRWLNLAVSGLALLCALGIAAYSSRQLLRPLAELVEVTRRMGDGDHGARAANLPNDELGELGRAFNAAAEQIARRQAAQELAEQDLRASESRFRLLAEHISDAIFLHSADAKIIDVNPAACRSLGYTREELLELSITDIVAGVSPEEFHERLRRTEHSPTGLSELASRHRRKDGTEFPVEVHVVPLRTHDGLQFLASVRDVSLRKQAEDKMTKFFRLSTDMMCVADAEGHFRELSPAFEQVLGWSREELLAYPYLDLVHPDDREQTIKEARRVFDGDGEVNFENRYRCKDGSYKWLQWRPFREIDEGMIYAIARDVTESHRMTRLMQETSHAASVGGWELDFLSGELFWTDETYRLHDTSPQEYTPTIETAIEFYAPESQPVIRAAVERAQRDGEPWSLELELITAKHRRIWAHAMGRVEREGGRAVRAYGAFQDITARKQAEEERQKLDAQIREMQRVESIGIFAGGVAHDFNNVLTSVLGFTRLALTEAEESDSLRSHLEQIERSALHAADLCKQLLAYAGKGRFVIETLKLSQLVRDTSGLIESIIDKRAQLTLELAHHLPWVEGDATQLRQVVMNLVINASDALSGHPGVITVKTYERYIEEAWLAETAVRNELMPGPYVLLEVTDNGVGMDEETRAKIFDPFFTTKFTGRGLGLAAALGIVRSHGGAIRVTSSPGKGTTFGIIFPISPDDEDEEDEKEKESGTSKSPPAAHELDAPDLPGTCVASAENPAILVIDDDEAVRAIARTSLERGGYRVLVAPSGEAGLALFAAQRDEIVAVLADATMPGMGGLAVLRRIRAEAPQLPLLLMSGYTEDAYREAADLRLAGFVSKPFRINELAAQIDAATGKT